LNTEVAGELIGYMMLKKGQANSSIDYRALLKEEIQAQTGHILTDENFEK
jgi:hypothetical protein